jgi:ATP-dependent Zn protease
VGVRTAALTGNYGFTANLTGEGRAASRLLPSIDPVNRFFRSALFPLIVIVLLVYLASQTLIPGKDAQEKVGYSEFIEQAKAGHVQEVKFTPTRQQIDATLVGGEKIKVNYPSDLSADRVEGILQRENIPYS